ncbi:MAG: hypothetical protein R3260_03040 [Pseudomonas sp.]|nr:hypothetical protein [Pseudomonas sp.]
MNENLTVEEVLHHARMLDLNLDALEQSAPDTVTALGGRDGLAKLCESTCIGPIPRVDAKTWARMSLEYEERREHGSINRG